MGYRRAAAPFSPARLVGVIPVEGGLGVILDQHEDRLRYCLAPADAQRLLEDVFSLLVVGKADSALTESREASRG